MPSSIRGPTGSRACRSGLAVARCGPSALGTPLPGYTESLRLDDRGALECTARLRAPRRAPELRRSRGSGSARPRSDARRRRQHARRARATLVFGAARRGVFAMRFAFPTAAGLVFCVAYACEGGELDAFTQYPNGGGSSGRGGSTSGGTSGVSGGGGEGGMGDTLVIDDFEDGDRLCFPQRRPLVRLERQHGKPNACHRDAVGGTTREQILPSLLGSRLRKVRCGRLQDFRFGRRPSTRAITQRSPSWHGRNPAPQRTSTSRSTWGMSISSRP